MAMYTVSFKDQVNAVTAVDFFEVIAPSAHSVVIHGWSLSQSTEVKDTEEEMAIITTNRGTGSVTGGSGGAAATEVSLKRTDTTATAVVETCNTTKLAVGSGTLTEMEVHCMNVRVPFLMWYTPETRPVILPGDYWTLELDAAVADAVKWSGTLWFEEV